MNVVRKFDYGGTKTLNLNQSFEAYTGVRYGVDPGRDNVAGTADDGVMEVWSISRDWPKFSETRTNTVNVAPREGNDQSTGLEFTYSKQLADGWSALFSYSSDYADHAGTYPQDPNSLIRSKAGRETTTG